VADDPTILNSSHAQPPAKGRGAAMIFAAATLLSIAASVGFDITGRFMHSYQEIIMSRYGRVDEQLTQAAHGQGLYLRFTNFQGEIAGYVTNFYFRAVYILYPQPVLVGDPSVVASLPYKVLAGNFDPTDQWLLQHNIHTVLTYHYDGRGFIRQERHVPAPPPATR
jgi:hypothetical protein